MDELRGAYNEISWAKVKGITDTAGILDQNVS